MKEIKTKKGFIFIKNKDQDILRDIKEYFEDPTIFLKLNKQIAIGKIPSYRKDINNNNNKINDSNNNIKYIKGANANTDTGINLSTIPNYSINQKTINSKEDNSPNSNNNNIIMNTISGSKDNNNNNNNNNSKTNNIFDFKKQKAEKTNYYNYINTEQNLFNHKSVGVANKNLLNINKIYSITEDDKNNGKNKKSSKDNNNNKVIVLISNKNENLKNSEKFEEPKKIKKRRIAYGIKNTKRPLSVGIHYKYETSNEIIKTYTVGKSREEESKIKGTNDLMPNEVVDKIKIKYLTQEKKLKEKNAQFNNDKNISNYLCKKCNKKEENLLYNNIENFRIKKQLLDYLESKKNLSERLGNKLWYINLRRPDFLKSARGLFVNIGKDEKQIWEPVVDFPMNNVEIIKKAETPHKKDNNFENFLKIKHLYPRNLYNYTKKNIKIRNKMPNLNEMNDMVIKGKNMILAEKENFLNHDDKLTLTGHKYRVFKDPREFNIKYSQDCLYKLNSQYTGLPYHKNMNN
jgi:hypothetical protein